jgi:peptide deformylase
MDIRKYPDPVLRTVTGRVETFDKDLADLAAEMIRTMHLAEGLGLAATQVGRSERVVIVAAEPKPGREQVLVNPEILEADGWEVSEEGCLSFPGIYVRVGRFTRVRVRFQDVEGRTHEMIAEGVLARAVQHELDHLDGRLLVDRMSAVQRMAQRRRLHELVDRFERQSQTAAKSGT